MACSAPASQLTPSSPMSGGSPSLPNSGPSRASLIEQAVDEGRIDPVTGLIYRAQSALGIAGLPDEFATGAPRADDTVIASMVMLMPSLSEGDQARLRPFVVRPTDPESVFAARQQAVAGIALAGDAPDDPAAQCATWADSGNLDSRFKVWACADNDAAAAEIDIATVAAMLIDVWPEMVAQPPAGMGPPRPDMCGSDVPNQHGGDARIDFYLVDSGQTVSREGGRGVGDNLGMAVPTRQQTACVGASVGAWSGYALLQRSQVSDEVGMKQTAIHELFHILEFAFNMEALFNGDWHWFVEASATWSEVFYDQANSDRPHTWFSAFQDADVGLENVDQDHEYAAYIWPFFMQQEKSSDAVFSAWAATESLGSGDLHGVTEAISRQLPFESNFHEFAMRNVNVQDVLVPAGVRTYEGSDDNFWEDERPTGRLQGGGLAGGETLEVPANAPPLAADYYNLDIAENARKVTISLANVQPASQMKSEALVHVVGGSWERRPLERGLLQFCREDPGDDIDEIWLVVSNHSRDQGLNGFVELSAKDRCAEDEIVLEGTIRGTGTVTPNHVNTIPDTTFGRFEVTMEVTITITPDDWNSTGTATVSGEYTGDCEFTDTDSGPMTPAGMRNFEVADPTDMIAWVQIYSSDPRFAQRPLTGLFISAFGKTATTGGTCGHQLGPVEPASPELYVTLDSCNFFEILNNNGTWHGECTQASDINPGTGQPYSTQHWTANLEQISPRESPPR